LNADVAIYRVVATRLIRAVLIEPSGVGGKNQTVAGSAIDRDIIVPGKKSNSAGWIDADDARVEAPSSDGIRAIEELQRLLRDKDETLN